MRGFTLLELIAVLAIISILAGMAYPAYVRISSHTRESEGWSALTAIRFSELRYYAEHEEIYTGALPDLDIDNPNTVATRLFTYTVTVSGPSFVATATPNATRCRGCRLLTLDDEGIKTP